MKNLFKFSMVLAAVALTMSSCNCFKKMAQHQDEVSLTCTPEVLTLNNGVVAADVTVKFPAQYFNKKAVVRFTPVIVYADGMVKGAPKYVQGEAVKDNYQVISTTSGGQYTQHVEFPFNEKMVQSELRVLVEVKCKNGASFTMINSTAGRAVTADEEMILAEGNTREAIALYTACGIKLADGVNTLQRDFHFGDVAGTAANNFKRTTNLVEKADILYKINSSVVNQKEVKKNQAVLDLKEYYESNLDNPKMKQSLYVNGYASPDGPEKFNDKLASARSNTGRKAVEKILEENGLSIDAAGYGEDWEGFKEMVAASDMKDKDLILQVLSMYDSSVQRESEIKNMSSVYSDLKTDILPKLRRAQLVDNIELAGYTNQEMLDLIAAGKMSELKIEELLHIAEVVTDNDKKIEILSFAAKKYDDSRAYTNLGGAYLKAGKTDKALDALKKAVKLGGNTQALNSNLALANLAAGNVDEAKKYAGAADAQTKSLVAAAQGNYSDAAKTLTGYNAAVAAVLNNDLSAAKKAIAKETSADADYLRAVIAVKENDLNTASAQLRSAVSKDASLAKKAETDVNLKPLRK